MLRASKKGLDSRETDRGRKRNRQIMNGWGRGGKGIAGYGYRQV